MVGFILLVIYLGLCYWVGVKGEETRAGRAGTMLISILITPILALLMLWAFAPGDTADR